MRRRSRSSAGRSSKRQKPIEQRAKKLRGCCKRRVMNQDIHEEELDAVTGRRAMRAGGGGVYEAAISGGRGRRAGNDEGMTRYSGARCGRARNGVAV